jgi:hypothetical protein
MAITKTERAIAVVGGVASIVGLFVIFRHRGTSVPAGASPAPQQVVSSAPVLGGSVSSGAAAALPQTGFDFALPQVQAAQPLKLPDLQMPPAAKIDVQGPITYGATYGNNAGATLNTYDVIADPSASPFTLTKGDVAPPLGIAALPITPIAIGGPQAQPSASGGCCNAAQQPYVSVTVTQPPPVTTALMVNPMAQYPTLSGQHPSVAQPNVWNSLVDWENSAQQFFFGKNTSLNYINSPGP